MSQIAMWKKCLMSSRSRSQRGFIWSKYDSFYYILWTVDTLATKLGLMLHYHKPECLVKKKNWITALRIKRRLGMSVFFPDDIFETAKHFVTKSHKPECHAKRLVCYFQGQGLIWSKYDSFYYIVWTADLFATKLGLIVLYHKPECLIAKLDSFVQGQSHS